MNSLQIIKTCLIDKFDKKLNIKIKENAVPVIKAGSRLPITIKDKLKEKLTNLENQGIISKVDYPTDWVHNITIVEKSGGDIRICLDPLE